MCGIKGWGTCRLELLNANKTWDWRLMTDYKFLVSLYILRTDLPSGVLMR